MGAKTVRGFIRGVIWGGVLATGGLVALSQFAPIRPGVPAEAEMAAVSGAPAEPPVAPEVSPPEASPAEASPAEVNPPADAAPVEAPGTAAVPAQPQPTQPQPEQAAPPQPPVVAAEAPPAIAPATATAPAAAAPKTPEAGAEPLPEAAQPLAPPQPSGGDTAATPPAAPAEPPARPPTEGPVMAGNGDATPAGAAPPRPGQGGATEGLPGQPVPAMPGAPLSEPAPQTAELPPPPPVVAQDEALLQPSPTPPPVAEGAAEPSAPVPSAEPATTVVTGRLPRIGDPAPPAEAAAEEGGAQSVDDAYDPALDESLPPVQRFARAFENPGQKPLFAILLEDRGAEVDRAALAALDLPLTIVIDPLSEGAAERAALWRAAGQELLLALTGFPPGATPGDVEQSLQALADRLPEAVAIIDPDGKVFQSDRLLASQIVAILAQQGRGLVSFDQGLNAADQVARREGLGSVMIFRRIDIDKASGPEVKRYLDRAVFRAAQEGSVAVIGTLSPDLVTGLMEWTVEGRAATVALAPLTALMAR